jgi:hypothetical protein
MDIRTPDRIDWKPLPPLYPVTLKKDRAFRRFDKYRGLRFKASYCPEFDVTATLTGRFDHSDEKLIALRAAGSGSVEVGPFRYGHMGAWNSQLVLQSVNNVVVKRIDPTKPR